MVTDIAVRNGLSALSAARLKFVYWRMCKAGAVQDYKRRKKALHDKSINNKPYEK